MNYSLQFRKQVRRSLPEDSPLYIVKRVPNTLTMDVVEVFCTSCWRNHTHGDDVLGARNTPSPRAAHCRHFPSYESYGYNYSGYYIENPSDSKEITVPPKSLAFASRIAEACYDSRFLDYMSEADIRDPNGENPMAWSHLKKQVCRTRYCGEDLFGVEFIKTDFELFVSVGMFEEGSTEMISSSKREIVYSRKEANNFIKLVGAPDYVRSSNAGLFEKVNKERKRLKRIAKESLKILF